jgi:hypothetical protein
MGKAEKKFAKKKERERDVKKKLLDRRQQIRQTAKENSGWDKEERQNRPRIRPILKEEHNDRQQEVRMAMEHNLEILNALEQEYLSQLSEEERVNTPNAEMLTGSTACFYSANK